ncbi:MAG: HAD family hydrolase [Chloroflexota bacterium]
MTDHTSARAVVFDFGGVLMKTVDYAPRHTWDDRLGLPRGSVERAVHNTKSWVEAQHGRLDINTYWADVAARLQLDAGQVVALAEDFYSGDQLDADLIALIRRVRGQGVPVALLSNDSVDLRPRLERLGIDSLFDPLVISAEIGVMKPERAAYTTVLDQLALPPEVTVFIDDRAENVEGARAAGMQAIHYHPGLSAAQILSQIGYA